MVQFSGPTLALSPRFFRAVWLIASLSVPVCRLLPEECPPIIQPQSHNDPPLLLVSVSNSEVGPQQEQQITVRISLPAERDSDYLTFWVRCESENHLEFSGTTSLKVGHSMKSWVVKARLPEFSGRGGKCYARGILNPKNVQSVIPSLATMEVQFRLLDGIDPASRKPRLISGRKDHAVKFSVPLIASWEHQDPPLSPAAVTELDNAARGMKTVVTRLHGIICDDTASGPAVWKLQQDALAIIRRARDRLLKESAGDPPSQTQRIEVFTDDLEQRLLELNLTDLRSRTGSPLEHPAAFNHLGDSDFGEAARKIADALLRQAETIWDALTDAEKTGLLYVAVSITSCPTHSTVEYNAKGYPPETARTDTILQLTKARIHFKFSDPGTNRQLEFDRDFFDQPERRVAVWCSDPFAEVWYPE